jgi:hypothetical protein
MKKLLFLLVTLIVYFKCGSQILDTISLPEFKGLKHKQIKALYANDEYALDLIQKNRKRKINSYVFLGLSVPFAVTLNPTFQFPLGIGLYKYANNTKKKLYKRLKYHERIKYNLDTISSKYFIDTISNKYSNDTNSVNYKFYNYSFDLSIDDFNKLSKKEIVDSYGFNDTAKWIIEYSKGKVLSKVLILTTGAGSLMFGGLIYLFATIPDGIPYQMAFVMGTPFVISGIWLEVNGIKMKNPKIEVYNNLKQYYTTHSVSSSMAKYIKNKREQYKQ